MVIAITNWKSVLLERREMCQTGKEKRVKRFGVLRTGNNAARENIVHLATLVRREIKDNPEVNPVLSRNMREKGCARERAE